MKNYLFILMGCLLLSGVAPAQRLPDIAGTWKVIHVDLASGIKAEERQAFDSIRTLFLKSTFYFKSNGRATLDAPDEELAIKDARWSFNKKNNIVSITENSLNGTPELLLELLVEEVNGRIYFHLNETPVKLTMEKLTANKKRKL